MSNFFIVCSPTGNPISESLPSFKEWVANRFPGAEVSEDQRYETRAVTWDWTSEGSTRWIAGSIDRDRKSISMKGDLDVVCETAISSMKLFPPSVDVVIANDSQGLVFDLRRVADARQLADALTNGNDGLEWRETG